MSWVLSPSLNWGKKLAIDLAKLNKNFAQTRSAPEAIDWGHKVDYSLLWIPEIISHLYHTSIYSLLTDQQQLYYNHMFARVITQQFVILERDALLNVKNKIFSSSSFAKSTSSEMIKAVDYFDQDEIDHINMFNRLMSLSTLEKPPIDTLVNSWASSYFFRFIFSQPRFFIFWTWLLIFAEERTVTIGRFYQKERDNVDNLFCQVHLKHLQDESRHVQLDEHFIQKYWDPAPIWLKKINIFIFKLFLKKTFVQSLSSIDLWKALVKKFPTLKELSPTAIKELNKLPRNKPYQIQIFSPKNVPRFWKLIAQRQEMSKLNQYLDDLITVK